jgi:hypothetical protein
MMKALPPAVSRPGAAFPWGLLAQIVLLVINIIEEIVEEKKK